MEKYRIREVALGFDKKNVWFYPEKCIMRNKKRFLRKPIEIEEWYNYYQSEKSGKIRCEITKKMSSLEKLFLKVIGFRDIESAKKWLDDYRKEEQKEYEAIKEKWSRNIGAEIFGYKFHEIN